MHDGWGINDDGGNREMSNPAFVFDHIHIIGQHPKAAARRCAEPRAKRAGIASMPG
jgi:hypothetical protein